ncbi:MAG: EI24 domain-containing protein [Saprospiraceae bacterium]|nr:EI24 domain-containing protein [Saprospiraceae bacterium]
MAQNHTDISIAVKQVVQTIQAIKQSIPFFKENKLLQGLFEHKWIVVLLIIGSLLYSYSFVKDVYEFFYTPLTDDVLQSSLTTSDLGKISDVVKEEGRKAAFTGGSKYLLLILLEVIIFFVSVKTIAILNNEPRKPTFKEFVRAEQRMIKVMIKNFILGIMAQIVIYIVLAIFGLSSLSGFFMFFVYAYFIGFAFLDNYNEQFEFNLKESRKVIQQHKYASTTIGILISGLLAVPVIGAIVTPFLGAVIATLYGHNCQMEEGIA